MVTTNPADIDLDALQASELSFANERKLIAAVKALREQVALLRNDQALGERLVTRAAARAEAAEACVAEIKLAATVRNVRIGKAFEDRALAAEAQLAETLEALEAMEAQFSHVDHEVIDRARAALATTPARALERDRLARGQGLPSALPECLFQFCPTVDKCKTDGCTYPRPTDSIVNGDV